MVEPEEVVTVCSCALTFVTDYSYQHGIIRPRVLVTYCSRLEVDSKVILELLRFSPCDLVGVIDQTL